MEQLNMYELLLCSILLITAILIFSGFYLHFAGKNSDSTISYLVTKALMSEASTF